MLPEPHARGSIPTNVDFSKSAVVIITALTAEDTTMSLVVTYFLISTLIPHSLSIQEIASQRKEDTAAHDQFPLDPIRPANAGVTDKSASDWLSRQEKEIDHRSEQIEYALSLVAQPKLSVEVRQRSLDLVVRWLDVETFPLLGDRLACRLLASGGDTTLQHMAIMQSMAHATSGSYVLRKYSDIMLHDKEAVIAKRGDDISPSDAIRLYGVSNLILRKRVTAEVAINHMLSLATMSEASSSCRRCAFEIIADVSSDACITRETVTEPTLRDMYAVAEAAVCDEGQPDALRAGAIAVWFNSACREMAATEKLVMKCAEISRNSGRSLEVRRRSLGLLKEAPKQFMSVAAESALSVISSEPGEHTDSRKLLEAAIECLSACGKGSDSEIEAIRDVAQRPGAADGLRQRALVLLEKWHIAE